jgi:hypothetical protein
MIPTLAPVGKPLLLSVSGVEVRFGGPVVVMAKPFPVVAVNIVLVDTVLLTDVLLELVKDGTVDPSAIQSCLEILRGVFESEQCKLMTL